MSIEFPALSIEFLDYPASDAPLGAITRPFGPEEYTT
jgi:hypothetical protein